MTAVDVNEVTFAIDDALEEGGLAVIESSNVSFDEYQDFKGTFRFDFDHCNKKS